MTPPNQGNPERTEPWIPGSLVSYTWKDLKVPVKAWMAGFITGLIVAYLIKVIPTG